MPHSDACNLARDVHVRLSKHEALFSVHEGQDDARMKSLADLIDKIERRWESSHAVMKNDIKESIDAVRDEARESNASMQRSVAEVHEAIHRSIAETNQSFSEMNNKIVRVLAWMVIGLVGAVTAMAVYIWVNRNFFPPGP